MTRKYYHTNGSNKSGFLKFVESSLRKFRSMGFLLSYFFVAFICVVCAGLAASVGIFVFNLIMGGVETLIPGLKPIIIGIAGFSGYFVFGISLMFLAPTFNFIFRLNKLVKPFRGGAFSLEAIPWMFHNSLIYLVRYLFLEFLTPSPLNILFYKMMGMKIGKGVIINTTNISDACLIEIDDYVTVGGSAHIIAHYSTNGYLVLAPVKIGKKTTIGLKATVFGDVVIGEGCLVKPHSVVLPKTKMENGSSL